MKLKLKESKTPWVPVANTKPAFNNAPAVVAAKGGELAALDHERFYVLLLDAKGREIGWELVSKGGTTECEVSVREVFVAALVKGAASIVVAHNHPSGVPDPSPEDRALTTRLTAAASILGIPLLDHIIIGREGFYSFAERRAL